jgi:hypothetical protein
MRLKQLKQGSLLVLAFGLAACGNHGEGGVITTTTLQGKVTQGPVKNATIFADRVGTGTRYVLDSGELSTKTDVAGNFTLNVPSDYGDYVLVSQGGTDIVSGNAAIQMLAPAGSANVTPLTTLVALTPASQQAALKLKIEATGIKSFDADISTQGTAATLFLSKSIETAIDTLGAGIASTGTTLNASQLNDVQLKAMTAVAASFNAEPDLLTSAHLTDGISKGITNAIPNFASDGVAVSTPATLATAVSNTVGDVATAMGNSTGSFDHSATTTEVATFTSGVQSSISTSTVANGNTAASVITVHPVLVLTSFNLSGVNIGGPVTITFSEDMNAATITASSFKVGNVTGTVTYNSATRTATFTPSANLAFNTTYTVTVTAAILDSHGNTLIVPTSALTFTTVPQVTGTTGGSTGGTGANF